MAVTVRIYASEEAAHEASARLADAGLGDAALFLPSQLAGREEMAVRAAVREGLLPEGQTQVCIRSLAEGRSLVSVSPIYGRGMEAIEIMERSGGSVDSALLRRYSSGSPAPFSDAIGMPVLTKFVPITGLISSYWRFSSLFGLGLLSRSAAPLSSIFGLPVLSSPKGKWTSSFGLPLLSRSPAPLSSMFGLGTISSPRRPWRYSFGLPLLSRNPAPLSSMFGIPTLSDDRRKNR